MAAMAGPAELEHSVVPKYADERSFELIGQTVALTYVSDFPCSDT